METIHSDTGAKSTGNRITMTYSSPCKLARENCVFCCKPAAHNIKRRIPIFLGLSVVLQPMADSMSEGLVIVAVELPAHLLRLMLMKRRLGLQWMADNLPVTLVSVVGTGSQASDHSTN